MQVNYNSALNQNVYLNLNQSLNRIATGVELNQSSDNASGLSIANSLTTQANGYSQAIENANSGIAATQIASGATNEQSKILDNVREKLLQASTATTSQEGRTALLKDIQSQLDQFNKIASGTNYNGQSLLQKSSTDTSGSDVQQYQTGLDGSKIVETSSVQSNTQGLGLNSLVNQDSTTFSSTDAKNFLSSVDKALNGLNDIRSQFGSTQNQLESTSRNLVSQQTSTLNAASLFETNYAKETSNFSKQNILSQIGAYGQAQANNINQQSVLRLLS